MTPFIGRQVVTIVRRSDGPPDHLGVPTVVETETSIPGCSVQPLTTAEQLSDVDQITSRWRAFLPAGTVMAAIDGVISDGVLYAVDGDPQPWTDAGGHPHHIECFLRRATG